MRTKIDYKTINVSKETHKRLIQERDEFERTIGGGKWSIDDTINELLKIVSTIK